MKNKFFFSLSVFVLFITVLSTGQSLAGPIQWNFDFSSLWFNSTAVYQDIAYLYPVSVWNPATMNWGDPGYVTKVEEDVYRVKDGSESLFPGKWLYLYTLTNIYPGHYLTSYGFQYSHDIVAWTVQYTGWNYRVYDDSKGKRHVFYTDWTHGIPSVGTGLTVQLGVWINDEFGPNHDDGDHGYGWWGSDWDLGLNYSEGYSPEPHMGWYYDGFIGNNISMPVPEPGTVLLLGSGLIGFGIVARIRRKRS